MADDTDFPRQREEMLIDHFENGRAHALDLLRADFGGHFPPAGLDIVNPPDYEVKLKGTMSDPYFYLEAVTHSVSKNWGKSGLLYFLLGLPKVALGLLAVSATMQMLRYRGYVRLELEPDVIRVNDIWAAARLLDDANETVANTIAHEHAHVLQAYDGRISLSSVFNNNRTMIRTLVPDDASTWVKYVSAEAEVQARLHTIITNGYVQHGRMPLSKYELWACLISQGMTPPPRVLEIAEDDMACKAIFHAYPKVDAYVKDHADNKATYALNHLHKKIDNPDYAFKLWDKVFPALYGDLLELYGDRLGHARMGHTHNIQLREIFMKAVRDHMKGGVDPEHTGAHMKRTAAMMHPRDAMGLMTLIARGDAYMEHAPEPIFIRAGRMRLFSVSVLASHPEIAPDQAIKHFTHATGHDFRDWKALMEMAETSPRGFSNYMRTRRGRVRDFPSADFS